jgi:hypothetical protein
MEFHLVNKKNMLMNRFAQALIFLLIILTASCTIFNKQKRPDQIITPLSDTVILRDGSLVYALPMTVFTVKVKMERTIELPGPYSKYAEEMLGLSNVIMNEEEHWSVKGILVDSHEEIDPSEFYVIESNTLQQTNVLALKKDGLILELNVESNVQSKNATEGKELNIAQFRSYDLGSDEYYMSQTDTAYKRVKVDAQFIRIPYTVEKKKKLTVDQLAERAAKRLMELRDGKIMILTGEANVFPQNEAAINELNRIEQEYTELFVGKTFTENRTFTYDYIPRKDINDKPFILFRFSDVTGPGEASSTNGTPVVIELKPEQKTKDLTIITREQPDPSAPKIDKIFYRIPDVASLKITMGKETLYNSRKLVYQLGEVLQLPANYMIGK